MEYVKCLTLAVAILLSLYAVQKFVYGVSEYHRDKIVGYDEVNWRHALEVVAALSWVFFYHITHKP